MSFSMDIKRVLSSVGPSDCCARAECYGMLLFSRTFKNGDVSVTTENAETAECFSRLMRRCFDCRVRITESGETRRRFKAEVTGEGDKKRVQNTYTRVWKCGTDGINRDRITKDCCVNSFLRGAFLSCGTVSDPEKQYRLEFVVKNNSLAVDLYGILYGKGLDPYMSARGKYVIVYIKKSENIEDLLTLMRASDYSLEMMSVKVVKEIRNNANRKNNFETANIAKTASAAVSQREAIKKLKKQGKLELLPDKLRKVAEIRMKYQDASLSELLVILEKNGEVLTRSGLNHRLSKLIELAKEQ